MKRNLNLKSSSAVRDSGKQEACYALSSSHFLFMFDSDEVLYSAENINIYTVTSELPDNQRLGPVDELADARLF